jgi:hypothetical protein
MPGIVPRNAAQETYRQRLYAQLANLPPDLRAFIGEEYGDSQIAVLPLPYWSSVRFQATRAAGPPVAFTIDTSQRRAFAYAQGQDMTIAGYTAAARTAFLSDTNLLKQSETRDNSDVWIWGISCSLLPTSEPVLAARVWADTSVELSLNGTQSIALGTLEMFPGAGGLYGAGKTFIRAPALNVASPNLADGPGEGAGVGFIQNGNPMAGNFFRLPQPFKWSGVGTAGAGSALSMTFTPRRAITESMTARVAVAGAAPGAEGRVEPATPPAAAGDIGTFVDVRVRLICVAVQRRSVNV